MFFVIAQTTKRMWQVEKSAKIVAFHSYFTLDAAEAGHDIGMQSANIEKHVTGSRKNHKS
jgi:hypothetical protein